MFPKQDQSIGSSISSYTGDESSNDDEVETSWINKARKKVNAARPKSQLLIPCTIFRVPEHIWQLERVAYDPQIISIGPFHHKLFKTYAMRIYKWRCVRYLLSRHRSPEHASQLLNHCLLELKAIDTKVRCHYSEDFPKLNANKLAQLMLLDGCFIIHLLLEGANRKMCTDWERKKKKEKKKRREMLLKTDAKKRLRDRERKEEEEEKEKRGEVVLEMEIAGEIEEEGEMIAGNEKREEEQENDRKEKKKEVELIRVEMETGKVKEEEEEEEEIGKEEEEEPELELEEEEPELELEIGEEEEEIDGPFIAGLFTNRLVLYDLLKLENQIPFFVIEMLFEILRTPGDQDIDLPKCALQLFKDIHPHQSKSFQTGSMGEIHHLLHLFYSSRVTSEQSTRKNITCPAAAPEWIPRATELAMAGVAFRKKREADSFLDITFEGGTMEIPPLRVYGYTGPLFRNLMAFEQCYFGTMTSVTIYAVFMDCLIDGTEDARLLHLKDILINRVSSDEAVVALFNQLCNQIYYAADRNYLQDLFVSVNKHYDSRYHRWRAGLMRDYFSNPWVIISVIAAVLLLLLTIEQAVFSGLSYLRPP